MVDNGTMVIGSLLIYKLVSLCVGGFLCYMGYRLFLAGVWGSAGDLNAQFGKNTLVLKSAAPGTFFALFGAIVIGLTVWKGLQFDAQEITPAQSARVTTSVPSNLPEKAPWDE